MKRATPQMRNLSRRLIAYETAENKSFAINAVPAAFAFPERLHLLLATLLGNGGFRALLSRALAMAAAEVPEFRSVQVRADGTLGGLEELHGRLDSDKLLEWRIVLLAHLLALLVAFIGASLTLNLVCEAWPQVSLTDLGLDDGARNENGARNEKTEYRG